MKRSAAILTLIIVSAMTQLSAQKNEFTALESANAELFRKNLYEASEKINTLECSFTQKQNLSLLAEEISSAGKMTFRKPDQLLWEYSSPYEFLFLMNGGKIITRSNGRTTTIDSGSSPLMKELCKIMIAGLRGDTKSLETSFTTSYLSDGRVVRISMLPKNKSLASIFKKIDLTFDASTFLVSSIEMSEPSGDNTTIFINNIKINSVVNDAVFNIH